MKRTEERWCSIKMMLEGGWGASVVHGREEVQSVTETPRAGGEMAARS